MRVSNIAAFATFIASAFSIPAPQDGGGEQDLCLQQKFLSALECSDLDPSYTNVTLPSAGWYCCWYQGPFLPPPALPVSAWLTFSENGTVANRCLAPGTCKEGLPNGLSKM
ncbi:uncharacterized protein F4807DRAFT_436683 [Annulohypoxylon truncatum]|uniref:uncharacterized protein n=1 Tax=Annulohypoxylon truncatum TaxID=327061 RepID=UPI0020076121|nr:uncharacterized protein F4807DRAFT_436683 [Annulohypoxylon truncatum]KAI1207016.1 hypothetical protein F4807DRAFT_436683 [Annulohypoxylon truncatum]